MMHHFCYSFARGELFCDHEVSIMLCIPPGMTVSRPWVVKCCNKEIIIIKKRDRGDNGVMQQTNSKVCAKLRAAGFYLFV